MISEEARRRSEESTKIVAQFISDVEDNFIYSSSQFDQPSFDVDSIHENFNDSSATHVDLAVPFFLSIRSFHLYENGEIMDEEILMDCFSKYIEFLHSIRSYNVEFMEFDDDTMGVRMLSSGMSSSFSRVLDQIESCYRKNLKTLQELVSWVRFQFKWIIWTFASYERKYPSKYLGKLLNFKCVYSAIQLRFSRYSSMSPLQRCCNIRCFLWPMVVCVSIESRDSSDCMEQYSQSFKTPAKRALDGSLKKNSERPKKLSIVITDGWWWCTSIVDDYIYDLTQQVMY
jgi:hypothetical protein